MAKKNYYCTKCGYRGKPKKKLKGNFTVELILIFIAFSIPLLIYYSVLNQKNSDAVLICFIIAFILFIPELFYRAWRYSSKADTCSKCGFEKVMIPADSPSLQKSDKKTETAKDTK